MPIPHPFPRGFVVHRGGHDLPLPSDWGRMDLGTSGWTFTHDPLEPAHLAADDDGRWVLVHGLCLYAGEDPRTMLPGERLLEAWTDSQHRFLETLDVLGGRHVVLAGENEDVWLYQDALGMRSVYFSEGADLTASHLHLLNSLVEHQPRSDEDGAQNTAAAWSRTPLLGVDAMLPNHRLLLGKWAVDRFFPREANSFTGLSVQERVELVRTMWGRQMSDLVQQDVRLVMSLTGGADSRTNLALCWQHRQQMEMFTYTTKTAGKSKFLKSYARDKAIVDRLLDLVPEARHRYFYLEDRNAALNPELQEVVRSNTTVNHGAWLLPHYIREFDSPNYVHLRGFGYEVGRAYWAVTEDNNTVESLRRLFLQRMERVKSPEPEDQRVAYFDQGLGRWEYDGDLHDYHKRDLYYWEMRMGRWGSEVMNETDVAFQTCVGFNVRRMLELSLSFPVADRKSGFFFAELINAAHPVLNFLGKNDVRNLYEIMRDERRNAARATAARERARVALDDHLVISRMGASAALLPTSGQQVEIPQEWFLPAVTCGRRFAPLERDGDLRFTVTSTYGHVSAKDYWRMQVWVNGRLQLSWDGGGAKRPVHVSATRLRAGDVVEVAAMALTDQTLSPSWSKASRAQIEDVQFDPQPAAGPVAVGADHPGVTRPHFGSTPRMSPYDVSSLTLEDFPVDRPARVDIDLGDTVVPLLVVRRHGSDQVLTLFNGAVDLDRSHGAPVFQRSSWWEEFPCSQIYVADPGSVGEHALSLSWGQVSETLSAIPGAMWALRGLAGILGATEPADRLYFGSSAGGFWAWSCAVLDHGARAVVNNAQIDWTRWMAAAVNELRSARFQNQLPADLRTAYPTRTNVLKAWDAQGFPTEVTYWVNVSSGHDRVVDLPQVEAFAMSHPDLTRNLSIRRYEDESSGHNPMGRSNTVAAIRESLNR